MEPSIGRELLRGQAAELPKLRDHVRLVGVTQAGRDAGPRDGVTSPGVCERRVEPSEAAVTLRWHAHELAEKA
jgi:hypothetical protein